MPSKKRPGKPRALSYEQAESARRRYVDTKVSPAVLAHDFSVSVGTMLAVLMCTGTYAGDGAPVKQRSVRYRGNQKLSDENVREIRELRNEGVTFEDLGVRFNINPGTALHVVNHTERFALVDPPHSESVEMSIPSPGVERALIVSKVGQMILAGRSAAELVDFVRIYR